ncbi:dihydrolipoyl dehydrogenase family protein [Cellulosimicrobium marinum]|uniref:dihydrolipoyl dehydrogenase family protein n=1 Tax=Cellulosimicrobium marinum TaxID=1638992 RepID=UPI001E5B2375|nr:NAD(P)/FAD-dependent oxidoreductase [Cellulosimicrobium marinum]MCB7136404.1 NAD(P)/FAD-dependent oxidoreductase [Cellulosimicrobium marinum]
MTSDPQDTTETFDVIVIGGGPVGENAADRAGRTGLSVALVEAELLGGECSYWACMPSKTLLRAGAVRAEVAGVPGVADPGEPDVAAVLAWRDSMVSDWDDSGQVAWVESAGITLVRGLGRIVGERRVEVVPEDRDADVDDLPPARVLVARHAVVAATGSVPVLPDVPGLADANPWTSREATAVEDVPETLAIVGGGVVACEMAFALTDLGARVTLLARGGLLERTEPWAGEAVAASLRDLGVDVRLGVSTTAVEALPDGGSRLSLEASGRGGDDGPDVTPVETERVLVATGRAPRTQDLGVDVLGLRPGRGLDVDDTMLVRGVDGGWLYAVGDVTGRVATTHQGKYQGRVAGDVVAARFGDPATEDAPTTGQTPPRTGQDPEPWSRYAATADHVASPQVVFTRPEVAAVGHTEQSARDAGLDVRVVRYDLANVAGSSVRSTDYAGTAQLVVDAAREVVVGATFVGPDAAEMLHAATVAIVGEVPLGRLWHAVPSYPTVSEVWLRFLEEYGL